METSSKEEKTSAEIAVGAVDAPDIFSIRDRVVLDPREARQEFGDDLVDTLKLSKDGNYILWPQPSDSPEDPQNWSDGKKNFQLFIIILASVISDFDVGIGIPAVFELAKQYNKTPGEINDIVQNWSIFLIGWGGLFFVPIVRRYGRLGTLFWTQLLALGFLVGATFAPTLAIFTAMRCLTAFFGTCPQITGLYTIIDLFPFHLQAQKINLWTMGIVLAPHLSPFLFGFLVAQASWRWAFGIGCIYSLIVLILIIMFMEESMYDRGPKGVSKPEKTSSANGLVHRLKNLVGIVGFQSANPELTWREVLLAPLNLVWRPHLLLILVFECAVFGFGIGINITNTVFLESPPPFGFGFTPTVVSGIYGTPVVAVFLGLFLGHYLNDWIMNQEIKRNKGIFRAEARLWTCYIGVLIYIVGFVILGAALQNHLNKAAIIIGWGIAQIAVLVITVPVYAYCNDCFPGEQGEISSLLNLTRTLGGFSVAFYQVSWAEKNGALQTLGCEAAIVAGCFILIIPFLQVKGRSLRRRFTPKEQKTVPAMNPGIQNT
ncbi:MFS general substrate transporter [Pholiota conissans]|uniref:MFS general substrate transporter n=1 Tax=Pholiota conissans TaxID=109636 RepID=A0A9P5ZEL8_9AGAR|nr:MFS general substrate transporter [Pholiota conissans]